MDSATQQRIEAAREEVNSSPLDPEHKDALQMLLDHAGRCANGTPDKIGAMSVAIADLIVRDVRREAREDARIAAAVAAHATTVPGSWREFVLRLASQYPVLVGFALLWLANRYGLEKLLSVLGLS
jgi:hypothetical protein